MQRLGLQLQRASLSHRPVPAHISASKGRFHVVKEKFKPCRPGGNTQTSENFAHYHAWTQAHKH